MNNKINKRQLIGISLIALYLSTGMILTSCSDELNALPSQSKVDGNLVVDQKSAIVALNGIYYSYALCGTDNYGVKSTACARWYGAMPGDLAGVYTYYQGAYMLESHPASYLARYSSYYWQPFYSAVNAANAVIEQVSQSPDSYYQGSKKQEILGEAYGMRALAFFDLLRYFGYSWDINSPYGILLRTDKSTATTLTLGRSSVKDTYEQIIADLDYAIQNAPTENEHCYMSKWAAKGLKARVLVQRGQGSDYQDAASLCADIIQNSPYTLEDNYADIFHKKGINSQEVILGIQPKENQTDVYEAYYYRGSAQWLPTDNFVALFEGDPRFQQIFSQVLTDQIGFREDGSYYIYQEVTNVFMKNIDPQNISANDVEESQYLLRLSEVYLLRAEALARTGNLGEAKELLKTVLSKAGIEDFSAVDAASTETEVLQQIFNEDLRNLASECGLEHNLMLRFPESIVLQFAPAYADKQYNVFGIPTDEFKYNNVLTEADQNPGFSVSE